MKVRRPELLLCTLFAGVLGLFTRAYWPMEPRNADLAQVIFWAVGLTCAVLAFRERGPRPRPRRLVRLGLGALQLLVGLLLILFLGWMHAATYVTGFIVSQTAAVTGFVCETIGLGVCAWMIWRRPDARPRYLAAGLTLLFLGSITSVLLNVWMWQPPSPQVCEASLVPDEVTRLSPAHWPADPSQPYSLLYIPEETLLLATFKMGGNGQLSFWNEPAANRVMGVDIRDPSRLGVIPLPGPKLSLYLTHSPETSTVLVSRIGAEAHSVDLLRLADFPRITHAASVEVDYAPHEVVTHPTAGTFGVFGHNGEFSLVQGDTLVEQTSIQMATGEERVPLTTLYAWHDPGTPRVYASFLLGRLGRLDMDTGQSQWSDELFGGGQLTSLAGMAEVFHTDILFNRVDAVSSDTLAVTRTLKLDYTPRPAQVDPSRDLLMVGDWFAGVVHFYRLSTLEPLGISVSVGPYMRDFAYDFERGLLFTASKCGVYQVGVDAMVSSEL